MQERLPIVLNRRRFLKVSASIAALAVLEACRPFPGRGDAGEFPWPYPARPWNPVTYPVDPSMVLAEAAPARGSTLRVLSYDGHLSPRIAAKTFPEQAGINVEVTTFSTVAQALELITHNNVAADLIVGVPKEAFGRMTAAGLFRPLNHSLLPNLGNLWPLFSTTEGSFWDAGLRYSVPFSVWTMGVVYTTETRTGPGLSPKLIDQANPYQVLWNSALSGRINLLSNYRQAVTLALLREGVTGTAGLNTDNPGTRSADLAAAKVALAELGQANAPGYSNEPIAAIETGAASAVQALSTDLLAGRQYRGPAWDPDLLLYYALPTGGGEVGGDLMAILSGGNNPSAAFTLMNWLLDNDNAMLNFASTGAQPPLRVIQSADQLVKGSSSALSGRYGSYALLVPWLDNTIVTEDRYRGGWFGALELTPDVETQWMNAAPATMTG